MPHLMTRATEPQWRAQDDRLSEILGLLRSQQAQVTDLQQELKEELLIL